MRGRGGEWGGGVWGRVVSRILSRPLEDGFAHLVNCSIIWMW